MGQERPKNPTWLQLGGPRDSEMEARPPKNRCQKTMRFGYRFWKGSDLVSEGFLTDFSMIFRASRAPTPTYRRSARNVTKPQFLRCFIHFADNARRAKNKQILTKIAEKTHV